MQIGTLTVTGKGKIEIPLRGWPRKVILFFKPSADPVPCDFPHHHRDKLSYQVIRENVRKPHKHHRHHHHYHIERKYFLVVKWKVASVRDVYWFAFY